MNKFCILFFLLYCNLSYCQEFQKKRLAILDFKNNINDEISYERVGYKYKEGFNISLLNDDGIRYLTNIFRNEIIIKMNESFDIITTDDMSLLLPDNIQIEDCINTCDIQIGRNIGAEYIISGEIIKIKNEFKLMFKLSDIRYATSIFYITLSGSDIYQFETQIKDDNFSLYKKISELNPKKNLFSEQTNNIEAIICANINEKVDCKNINFKSINEITTNYPLDCFNIWIKVDEERYSPLMANEKTLFGRNIMQQIKDISQSLFKNYKKCLNNNSNNWIATFDKSWESSKWQSKVNNDINILNEKLSIKDILNVINENNWKINTCIPFIIKNDKINIKFEIEGKSGNVKNINILNEEYKETQFDKCFRNIAMKWKFPKFKSELMSVKMPFILEKSF